jgi:crotonobetainyl-CoA:carnitine CoA-transferase CaiB-like acyl-CoA transferase
MFIADVGGGAMHAVVGILAALFGRERHGCGASIDISMHEASLYWMMLPAARELVEHGYEAVGELPTFGGHACYNVYRTADGERIALGALEPKFWRSFCAAIGRADLEPRQLTDEGDQASLKAEVARVFGSRTRDEWMAFFAAHDVCLTPVNSPVEALADPHVVARRAVTTAGAGARALRAPFLAQRVELDPAPEVGAHTEEILGP